MMAGETWHYRAYLLRLWWTGSAAYAVCRASLEDPHTGVRTGFGSLEELLAFLASPIGAGVPENEEPRTTPGEEPDAGTWKEE